MESEKSMSFMEIPEIPSVKFGKFIDEKKGMDELLQLLERITTDKTTSTFNDGFVNGFDEVNLSFVISYEFLPLEYLSRFTTNVVFRGVTKTFFSELKRRLIILTRSDDFKWINIEVEGERDINDVGEKGDLIIVMKPTKKY
jgi:hypothetical protein